MINPFTLMHPGFLNAYLQRKTIYLIVQNLTLENNLFKQEGKDYVLVSHYADKGKALEHYHKIKSDDLSNFIDLSNETQKQQFEKMLNKESSYVMYSVLADREATKRAIDKLLKYNIQKYLADKNWHIPRNYEMVPVMETEFGVLHVILGFSNRKIKVPLSELENYK